jgi:hypothetical protein
MINILPTEIIIKIFDYLDHEALMKAYKFDNYKSIIKNNVWPNITIKFLKNKRIQKFFNDGWICCFVKYQLAYSEVDNDYIKYFIHCTYLDLYKCYKLDTGCTQYLTNCHTIDLSYNHNIIDEDILYLKNCHTVRLVNCLKLTNKCTEYLKNCYEVDLNECNIDDTGVVNLSMCKIVRLGQTIITRNCIKYLTNCIELDISDTNIIDDDLKLLENIENLNISYCKNITLNGIQYLKNIQTLNLEMCFNNIDYIDYININYPYIELNRSIPLSKLNPEDQ